MAGVTLVIGILTFFVPLVTTNPPVLNKTRWSVFDIVQHVWARELPPGPDWEQAIVYFPVDCLLLYVFLLFAVVKLRSPEAHRTLALVAALSIYLDAWMWRTWKAFEVTFYGHVSYDNMSSVRHVGLGELALVQLAVWGALLFIIADEDLDAESSAKGVQPDADSTKSSEPEFLEVEILPPEEPEAMRRDRRAPRLHD